jgi:filamentous hemagglutinin
LTGSARPIVARGSSWTLDERLSVDLSGFERASAAARGGVAEPIVVLNRVDGWSRGGYASRGVGGNTSVYRSANAAGETQYVGITKNIEQRAAAHLREKGIGIAEIPGLKRLSRADARAVEQVLIEHHGLGKNGGTLLNKINSIAETNPAYGAALERGAELLQGAGYPGF